MGNRTDAQRKGGLARSASLTPEERSASAQRAAQARWHAAGTKTITHPFQLRPDLRIHLTLPSDLSRREVDRLKRWIDVLVPDGED